MLAACTTTPSSSPSMSTATWRLRPFSRLAASQPRGPPLSGGTGGEAERGSWQPRQFPAQPRAEVRIGSQQRQDLLDSWVGDKRQIPIPNRDFRAYLSCVVAQDVRDIARNMHEVVRM